MKTWYQFLDFGNKKEPGSDVRRESTGNRLPVLDIKRRDPCARRGPADEKDASGARRLDITSSTCDDPGKLPRLTAKHPRRPVPLCSTCHADASSYLWMWWKWEASSPSHDCRLMHFYRPHFVSANHPLISTAYSHRRRYIVLRPRLSPHLGTTPFHFPHSVSRP